MLDLKKYAGFEWDKGNIDKNIDKNIEKHGITLKGAEEFFLDENLLIIEDIDHSQKEKRYIAIGKTVQNIILFSAFTIRKNKIRFISVRKANKKERSQYEET